MDGDLGLWGVPLAIFAGAIRVSTPFLFVSLGECITEKAGRINLGLEGTLVFGAMAGYAISYTTGSPWAGVLAAALAGALFGVLHGLICSLPRVNDVAVGIALMLLGTGLAFYFGKPYIQPKAPVLPGFDLSFGLLPPRLAEAATINPLFLTGLAAAPLLAWGFRNTRTGLVVRMVGDSGDAARAVGIAAMPVRVAATAAGGFFAGIGGAFLSLYYPGSWNEALSSGQGLMAVALVIFARWNPVACVWAAFVFGGAGALGPALQSVGVTQGYYLFNAAPYLLTLVIMAVMCSRKRSLAGMPAELGIAR